MKRAVLLLSAIVCAAASSGCSHDYKVDFRYLTDAAPEVIVTGEEIIIPEGMAVGVEAIAVEDDERIGDNVEFIPARPGVIGMDPGLEDGNWVFYGVAVGSTSVDVLFNEDFKFELRAEVIPQ